MRVGVVYLLTHIQLAARLVVSIHSLRKWYTGPITLFTTRPDSHRIGALLAEDKRLGVEVARLKERRGEGYISSYITKTAAVRSSPYDATVFFDADTIIVGSLAELFHAAKTTPITATQYCNWTTTFAPVKERIEQWKALRGGAAKRCDLTRLVEFATATHRCRRSTPASSPSRAARRS